MAAAETRRGLVRERSGGGGGSVISTIVTSLPGPQRRRARLQATEPPLVLSPEFTKVKLEIGEGDIVTVSLKPLNDLGFRVDVVNGKLGAGAFGGVYKAERDTVQGDGSVVREYYAIKFVGVWNNFKGMDVSVLREAGVLAKLNHPTIMRGIYAINIPMGDYTIIAFVLPRALNTFDGWATSPQMYPELKDQEGIRKHIGQLACSVAYMETNHVLHGDIKPANTLLTSGKDLVLTDFGLSRFMSYPDRRVSEVLYTPYCRPPETIKWITMTGSDVWAMGNTMFTIVTGVYLFPKSIAWTLYSLTKDDRDTNQRMYEMYNSIEKYLMFNDWDEAQKIAQRAFDESGESMVSVIGNYREKGLARKLDDEHWRLFVILVSQCLQFDIGGRPSAQDIVAKSRFLVRDPRYTCVTPVLPIDVPEIGSEERWVRLRARALGWLESTIAPRRLTEYQKTTLFSQSASMIDRGVYSLWKLKRLSDTYVMAYTRVALLLAEDMEEFDGVPKVDEDFVGPEGENKFPTLPEFLRAETLLVQALAYCIQTNNAFVTCAYANKLTPGQTSDIIRRVMRQRNITQTEAVHYVVENTRKRVASLYLKNYAALSIDPAKVGRLRERMQEMCRRQAEPVPPPANVTGDLVDFCTILQNLTKV